MSDRVYLDASFVIALLVKEHPFHLEATKKLKRLNNIELFISLFVIDEVVFALKKYGLTKDEVVQHLTKSFLLLKNLELLNVPAELETVTDYLDFWVTVPLKPADTVHVFTMLINSVSVIATFDQDFIKVQKQLGIEVL